MSPSSRRPAPAFITVLVGALWRCRQIAGGDDRGVQKASSDLHQGDHLVTTCLWSEYIVVLNSSATPPADSLNRQLTLS